MRSAAAFPASTATPSRSYTRPAPRLATSELAPATCSPARARRRSRRGRRTEPGPGESDAALARAWQENACVVAQSAYQESRTMAAPNGTTEIVNGTVEQTNER